MNNAELIELLEVLTGKRISNTEPDNKDRPRGIYREQFIQWMEKQNIGEKVQERMLRLNKFPLSECSIPRGHHRKMQNGYLPNLDVHGIKEFIDVFGIEEYRKLPKTAFYRKGNRKWITGETFFIMRNRKGNDI